MAEPMHARVPARHPANRRPRIPHPHLAPQPQRPAREEEALPDDPQDHHTRTGSSDWTAIDVPVARPASRSRRGSGRPTPAEKTLRSALHAGLFVNVAVLLASRLLPEDALGGWSYGGDDFLLAAAVLLSGYALLAAGRLSRRDPED
ncbi:MAG TPA: hypothetical protein VH394_03270 [Thermoanaerobaculia bacterium]|jgi:hypothetical protein|nr:hypothetical protein [Thermoanaerobaculia bacterium]